MNIYDLILISPFVLLIYGIWLHNNVSITARSAAKRHCEQSGVQLLDQNILLQKMSIARSPHSLLAFKRIYGFEFSTVGDFRYRGTIEMIGQRVQVIELEPFKIL